MDVVGPRAASAALEALPKVVLLVPYRPCALTDMRGSFVKFLRYMPPKLDSVLGQGRWKMLIGVQTWDGHLMSCSRVFNALARLAHQRYPDHRLVFHDVDLFPNGERLREYCMPYPPGCQVLALYGEYPEAHIWRQSDPAFVYIGGVCAMDYDTFAAVNGFNNEWEGWGREDLALCSRLRATGVRVHTCGPGHIKNLSSPALQKGKSSRSRPECKLSTAKRNDVYTAEVAPGARINGLSELVFALAQPLTVLETVHPSVEQCFLHVYVTLPDGWKMRMTSRGGHGRGRPLYYDEFGTMKPLFEVPSGAVVEKGLPPMPEDSLIVGMPEVLSATAAPKDSDACGGTMEVVDEPISSSSGGGSSSGRAGESLKRQRVASVVPFQ